ncbi:methyl-accepting chemotaxis protein [Photobacterium sp. J15]|uniref:methyl-accepting chemotaxis protein n=1 Tax=Photobacterium sp. J15 TaxID=265901 RepID=UPI0007E3EBA5|nr:methyl-accepting chemotaxis protein [Photobacterium sp. J15]
MHNIQSASYFGRRSVRWKFLLAAGGSLVITVTALIFSFFYANQQTQDLVRQQMEENLKQSAELYIEELAGEQSLLIQRLFDRSFDRAEMLRSSLLFLKKNSAENQIPAEKLRLSMNQLIQQTVSDNAQMLGIYVVFDKNALDGEDAKFVYAEELAGTSIGRFAPYWARNSDGSVELEVLLEEDLYDTELDDNQMPMNEWYACSMRNNGQACVLNPYLDTVDGEEMLMTSLTLPLKENGRLIGMLGIDFSLADIQSMINQADRRIFDGDGEVILLSHGGLIVGYDAKPALVGEHLKAGNFVSEGSLLNWLKNPKYSVQWQNDGQILEACVPVKFAGNEQPWGMVFELPRESVMARAIALQESLKTANEENTSKITMIAVVVTLLALAIIWLLAARLVAPIRMVADRLQDIATGEGDLTRRLTVNSEDELGALANGFNLFVDKLQGTVKQIAGSVDVAKQSAEQASQISHRTSDGMQQQLSEIDLVASAALEMASTAQEVASHAGRAVSSAQEANNAAEQGKGVIAQTTEAMSSLVDEVSATVPIADRLAQNSDNIDSILEVIEAIAEQTNLLALNAAIEAARAGEQGRGFAVVADEVRTLAGRTQDSISQIREVIDSLKAGTGEVVEAIQKGNDKALITAEQVKETVAVLEQIITHISSIDDISNLISVAATEQHNVAGELSCNVSNIRDVSQSVSAGAEDSAIGSHQLEALMQELQVLVRQFKVK